MMNHFGWLCSAEPVMRGGLLAGLFVAGVAGSAMHCGPMCGIFVLGQVADRISQLPAAGLCEWQRVRSGLLLPYHAGRLTTYGVLGALAGGPALVFRHAAWLHTMSSALLALAALLFLLHASGRSAWLERRSVGLGRLAGLLTRFIPRGSAVGEFLTGMALGLLPCGFLYAALVTTAASGGLVWGAAGMVAFGLGTVPVLAMVGVAGHAAQRRWQRGVAVTAPAVMAVNALLLLGLAWRGMV